MFHRLTAGDLELFCFFLFVFVFFLVVLGFCVGGLVLCLFWFPHGLEITPVVCEVVCEVERPPELSWRARHGRQKKRKKKGYWC